VTATGPWDGTFERLLRSRLPATIEVALEPEVPLTHYGLTSLGYLELGRALSEHYGISIGAFTERAFRTVGSLWHFVADSQLERVADSQLAVRADEQLESSGPVQ
jgi:acyl carrier protein